MLYIFIDTNVWLSAYSSDDPKSSYVLEKLNKIINNSNAKSKKVELLLNDCIYNEFIRNRTIKIEKGIQFFIIDSNNNLNQNIKAIN